MSSDARRTAPYSLPLFEYEVIETLHVGPRVNVDRVRPPEGESTMLLRTPRVRTDSAHVRALE